MCEILVRLPAKDLCRQWRSLFSDPHFIARHHHRDSASAAGIVTRHAETKDGALFDILDLSGRRVLIKQVAAGEEEEQLISTQLGMVRYSWRTSSSFRLLDPAANGTIYALPDGLAQEHEVHGLDISDYSVMVASSRIPATGELKVLRVLSSHPNNDAPGQLCEVYTLGGDQCRRWRGIDAPPHDVTFGQWCSAVINGIVYFLSDEHVHDQDAGPDRIASFDLQTQEWRPSLRGPLSSLLNGTDEDYTHDTYFDWYDYKLASLSGRLVLVHCTPMPSTDLWVLMDAQKGSSWVMQHRIETGDTILPLLVLNDDRIVFVKIGSRGSLRVYDPRTNYTFIDSSETSRDFHVVGLYTGSLLTLASES
ncbi:hypothetical protein EJB05_14863, partial [Eragrostis curvula]